MKKVERHRYKDKKIIQTRTLTFEPYSYDEIDTVIEKIQDKNEKTKVEFGGEKRASRIFCWMKMTRFTTNFKMERSKKIRYWQKITENGRKGFLKFFGRIRKSIQFGQIGSKIIVFYMVFYS